MAASAKRNVPDAPIGFDDSTPPLMFTGRSPSMRVTPSSTMRHPSPGPAKRRFSNHMGSNHENGTYISTQSIWLRGSVMPAWRYTSLAHWMPPRGNTGSRPADIVGSDRIAVPCTHAGGRLPDNASSAASTIAHAPSDDGHVSA